MAQEFWYTISGAPHDLPAGYDDFSNVGGANKNASMQIGGGRVGPATHDNNTTYISGSTNETLIEQALNVSWPGPMQAYSGVFTAGARHRYVSGPVAILREAYFTNSAGTRPTNFVSVTNSNTSYEDGGPNDVSNAALYRPGGGTWGITDFDDEQSIFAGVAHSTAPTGNTISRFTSIWGEISFNPMSGGMIFLLNLAGLGALPFVGRLVDFAQFTHYLTWRRACHRRHTLLTPDEARVAWCELRAYTWPKRIFLGAA